MMLSCKTSSKFCKFFIKIVLYFALFVSCPCLKINKIQTETVYAEENNLKFIYYYILIQESENDCLRNQIMLNRLETVGIQKDTDRGVIFCNIC